MVRSVFVCVVALSTLVAAAFAAGAPELVSVRPPGSASGSSGGAAASADGRVVAFTSTAALVPRAPQPSQLVYVRDRRLGRTTVASVSTSGEFARGSSLDASVSGDGRFVAFSSTGPNLVPGDRLLFGVDPKIAEGFRDVFVHDRRTGRTTLISRTRSGRPAGQSSQPQLSANGRFAVFTSSSEKLVPGDRNQDSNVFVGDRATGVVRRVSVRDGGAEAQDASDSPSISADGRFVVFYSASALVRGKRSGLYVRDRRAARTLWVGAGYTPWIAANGELVAFHTSNELTPEDRDGETSVYVWHRRTGRTRYVAAGDARPKLSPDASVVGFMRGGDVYAKSLTTGRLRRLTTGGDLETSFLGDLSRAGAVIVFSRAHEVWAAR